MTSDEMDRDVADAASYLSVTTVKVDRCRHETVDETTLWFFDDKGRQLAAASRLPGGEHYRKACDYKWEVRRMLRGQPVASMCERSLLDVIGNVMRYQPRH